VLRLAYCRLVQLTEEVVGNSRERALDIIARNVGASFARDVDPDDDDDGGGGQSGSDGVCDLRERRRRVWLWLRFGCTKHHTPPTSATASLPPSQLPEREIVELDVSD
jgi:hypothetical protein